MELNLIADFLNGSVGAQKNHWSAQGVFSVAGRSVPDGLLGMRAAILRADVNLLWARWFIESLCGPALREETRSGYAFVLNDVRRQIDQRYSEYPQDERNALARTVARFLLEEAGRTIRARQSLSREDRLTLLDAAGDPPRCWICGYEFDQTAIDSFLITPRPQQSKTFVDFMKPRLRQRDYSIEVDHIVPYSEGGGDGSNLAISCGWCNKSKGGRLSIYDVQARSGTMKHPTLGVTSVPQPFWVVRILAIRRRCEFNLCEETVATTELTVIPRNLAGTMNPMNLMVTCAKHDRLGEARLVHRKLLDKLEA